MWALHDPPNHDLLRPPAHARRDVYDEPLSFGLFTDVISEQADGRGVPDLATFDAHGGFGEELDPQAAAGSAGRAGVVGSPG